MEALKVLIEQPAVVFADKIMFKSSDMRLAYVKYLWILYANGEYWVDKTDILDVELTDTSRKERRRLPVEWGIKPDDIIVLLHINASFLIVNKEAAVEKIQSVIKAMLEEYDCFRCLFSPHESLDSIADEKSEVGDCYRRILDIVSSDNRIIFDKDHQAGRYLYSIAGYYGNEGLLVNKCIQSGVPVMIMDCERI